MVDDLEKGLEGVLVDESELSYIDGDEGTLLYRGYHIDDLAAEASFEEVLYLLWHGTLPTRSELETFTESMTREAAIDEDMYGTLEALAAADEHPMSALRTGASMLSAYEPERGADHEDLEASLRMGRRITAKLPTILAAYERIRAGEEPVDPDPSLDLAANFLYMLHGEEPSSLAAETFDMALILHADHGMNASTFTALVIASTMADVYCGVTGGIGALSGPLHGGANQDVMEVLMEIDESDLDPEDWIRQAVDEGRRIPGHGHRVYNVKDPRAHILGEKARQLGGEGEMPWYEYASTIESYLAEQGLPEKGIAPNVDFYSGAVYDQLGIPMDAFPAVFAISRVGGWIGHILEYQSDNRLIRPRARYTGPGERSFPTIDER